MGRSVCVHGAVCWPGDAPELDSARTITPLSLSIRRAYSSPTVDSVPIGRPGHLEKRRFRAEMRLRVGGADA